MITLARSPEAQAAAAAEWMAFNDDYLIERIASTGRLEVIFACVDDAVTRLQSLVSGERSPDSRVLWTTEVQGHHLTVVITGDADAVVEAGRLLR